MRRCQIWGRLVETSTVTIIFGSKKERFSTGIVAAQCLGSNHVNTNPGVVQEHSDQKVAWWTSLQV